MDKHRIAYDAALTYIARNGWTAEQFGYDALRDYAAAIARALVSGHGTRDASVNGMTLIHCSLGYYVTGLPPMGPFAAPRLAPTIGKVVA